MDLEGHEMDKEMEKKWRETDFECPKCGCIADVNTNAPDDYFYDGDDLLCSECGTNGYIMVDDSTAYDMWNNYED